MKRSIGNCVIIFILFILALLCVAFFQVGQEAFNTTRVFVSTAFTALTQLDGKLNPSAPFKDSPERFASRKGLIRSSGNFVTKPFLFGWGKAFFPKQRIKSPGFFIPAMVFLLFFQFYQNSRTCSENDPAIIFGN